MKVTYYGHSCFKVEVMGKHLLFDPFIQPNPRAAHLRIQDIVADYILITHGHSDHLADVTDFIQQTSAPLVSNWEICAWFESQGVSKTYRMNHGGTIRLPFAKIKYVYAQHSSSLPDGSYGGNPGGFIVESEEGTFYYSGDTGLMMDMKLIGEMFQLQFAALPIGDIFTMGIKDAVKAAELLKVKNVLGLHYDTYPPIEINHQAAISYFQKAGLSLHLVPIGKSLSL